MSAPCVYSAVVAITAELASHGIAKSHANEAEGYKYRSIDDLLDRLAPLLARHRLCVFPRALERQVARVADGKGRLLSHVSLRVSFLLTSGEDGSHHSIEAFGEALDGGDKATAKALSAAYKSAMILTFCIPVSGEDDSDHPSHRLIARVHEAEPVQGWEQWYSDIIDIIDVCESELAIATVQERNRELLKSMSREQPELYRQLGAAFQGRRSLLAERERALRSNAKVSPAKRTRRAAPPTQDVVA